MLHRPARTRWHHPALQPGSPIEVWMEEYMAGRVQRVVEDVPGERPYDTYTEADDRMVYLMYWSVLHPINPTNCIVESEDGDTQISLMCTYRTRLMCGSNKRIFLRRREGCGYRLGTDGRKVPVKQVEWIDIDATCRFVDIWLGGTLGYDAHDTKDPEVLQQILHCDPIIFFCMMALMCKNDYVEGLYGMSAKNIVRGAMLRPDLARRALHVQYPTYSDELSDMEKARMPYSCRINVDAMYDWLAVCYSNAHTYHRVSRKLYPLPERQLIEAFCARLSWMLDKCVNAGRPGYRLPYPFQCDPITRLPIFGYEWYEDPPDETEAEGKRDKPRKKRCVYTGKEPVEKHIVYPREWMGVSHE